MALPLTRAALRDAIRMRLGITPPSMKDPSSADYAQTAGLFPTWAAWPSNAEINEALEEATRVINQRCAFRLNTSLTVTVPASPASFRGALSVDLTGITANGREPGSINEIQRVHFTDSLGTPAPPLLPLSRTTIDNLRWQIDNQVPAPPQQYWIEGYALNLYPAPNLAGTLQVIAGTAIVGFVTDTDVIEQLPSDYHIVWADFAAAELAGRNAQNVEYQGIAQRCNQKAESGILAILTWKNGEINQGEQPSIGVRTYRRGGTGNFSGRR